MQGREQEWLFATEEGRWQVAAECLSKRVIFVILNRGHAFKGTQAVSKEISPLVTDDEAQKHTCLIFSMALHTQHDMCLISKVFQSMCL